LRYADCSTRRALPESTKTAKDVPRTRRFRGARMNADASLRWREQQIVLAKKNRSRWGSVSGKVGELQHRMRLLMGINAAGQV